MFSRQSRIDHRNPLRGFTLIELLVVVAILSLLVSILLPSLGRAKIAARAAVCMSNLRQYTMANELYANSFNDKYVPVLTAWGVSETGHDHDPWMWNSTYLELLGSPDLRLNTKIGENEKLWCPDLTQASTYRSGFVPSYGMNMMYVDGYVSFENLWMVDRSRVERPSVAAEITDCTIWYIYSMSYADYVLRWDVKGENHSSSIAYRHFGGTKVNVGHFDGSVECLSRPEAWHNDPAMDEQLWVIYGEK